MGRSVSVAASPIKSIQEGYVATTTATAGSGEDANYVDVTLSAVNVGKSVVSVSGSGSGSTSGPGLYSFSSGSTIAVATGRLTSPTNLRISCLGISASGIRARWRVVEYN